MSLLQLFWCSSCCVKIGTMLLWVTESGTCLTVSALSRRTASYVMRVLTWYFWLHSCEFDSPYILKAHVAFSHIRNAGATACCHPSFMGEEKALAEACVMPVCVLPANGDPMDDVKAVMDTKPLGPKCIYQRFDDQTHGFRECCNTPENSNTSEKPFLVRAHLLVHLLF